MTDAPVRHAMLITLDPSEDGRALTIRTKCSCSTTDFTIPVAHVRSVATVLTAASEAAPTLMSRQSVVVLDTPEQRQQLVALFEQQIREGAMPEPAVSSKDEDPRR